MSNEPQQPKNGKEPGDGDARDGRGEADDVSFERLIEIMREMAGRAFAAERNPAHTLQPTAIVNEAWLKLFGNGDRKVNDERHLRALSARAMRRVLVDHAREKNAQKRKAPGERVDLESITVPGAEDPLDIVSLDEALRRFEAQHEKPARAIELWAFGGFKIETVADTLEVHPSTARRWRAEYMVFLEDLQGPD